MEEEETEVESGPPGWRRITLVLSHRAFSGDLAQQINSCHHPTFLDSSFIKELVPAIIIKLYRDGGSTVT